MSNIPVEADALPDPAATSVANDASMDVEAKTDSAAASKDVEMSEAKKEEVGDDKKAVKVEDSGDAEKKNGEFNKPRTNFKDRRGNGNRGNYKGNNYQRRERNRKFDPSRLEKSSDHRQILNQVRIISQLEAKLRSPALTSLRRSSFISAMPIFRQTNSFMKR